MGDAMDQDISAQSVLPLEANLLRADSHAKKDGEPGRAIVYSRPRNNVIPMNRKTSESAVDRLIALASDEKPAQPGNQNAEGNTDLEVFGDQARDMEHNPMLKALMPLGALLPYVSRMMEAGQHESTTALSAELKQTVSELAIGQRDLREVVQDQLVQMKHIEAEMTRAREASERNASESLEIVDDVRSVQSALKRGAISIGTLLLALIGLVIWVLIRGHYR